MTMICNFEKDDREVRRAEKLIMRLPPVRDIGTDTPSIRPAKHGSYLWLAGSRRRSGRNWREVSSVN